MARDHILMFTLCGILIINVLSIVLLNNQLADRERAANTTGTITGTTGTDAALPPPSPAQLPPIRTQQEVRTLVLEDTQHCPDCFDIGQYITALNDTINMRVETVPQDKVSLFASQKLPALAFNATLETYTTIIRGWDVAGFTINISNGPYAGKWYVLPTQNAPYYAVNESRVHGRVTVTYLTMPSCGECYDVFMLRSRLNSSRITPYKELTVDATSAEGRRLIAKYSISNAPTIILDSEANEYPNLQPGWNIVGTVEPDGSYVLRDLQRLNVTYYDLAHKKLMKP